MKPYNQYRRPTLAGETFLQERKVSYLRALEEQLGREGRRVVSDWRALLLLRRATAELGAGKRRWSTAPTSLDEIRRILGRLVGNGQLVAVPDVNGLYQVQSPFAARGPIDDYEILMELQPYAGLSHHSALAFHGLTSDFPQEHHAIVARGSSEIRLPTGTTLAEWEGLSAPPARMTEKIGGRVVHWHRIEDRRYFSVQEYRPQLFPVRVTTPERTLADALLQPDWCGGLTSVLNAWRECTDQLDLPALLDIVARFNIAILRQRVGFVLEELGVRHQTLDHWADSAKRGGSSKLDGAMPFSPKFSERWKMSLNAPYEMLRDP